MGARNLIAGLLIFVVISHNIQSLAAVPGNILLDFRQSDPGPKDLEKEKAQQKAGACLVSWQATVGDKCVAEDKVVSLRKELKDKYGEISKAPPKELKKFVILVCQLNLQCSNVTSKCECEKPSPDSSTCKGQPIPKKDVNKNCDSELGSGRSVTDAGQNFQYMILMAVIFVIINAN